MKKEIPIYLFTGFLESGKTKFIQETLEDPRFSNGDPTLVLVCEEGVEEFDLKKVPQKDIFIETVDSPEDFTAELLESFYKKYKFDRVIIEFNGMWMLDTLYGNLPENFTVYQEMCFVDASTFEGYNANMRSLVVDKFTACELVVFNRCTDETDKNLLHKIVRTTSRRCDIAYEYTDGSVEYDDIEDPLPFDLEADVVEIADADYAIWYRDTAENLDKYNNKTVKFLANVSKNSAFPNILVAGRQVMTCCIEDTKFAGFICETKEADNYNSGDWITLTAKIEVRHHDIYKRVGPVLIPVSIEKAQAPSEIIASFY